jgi:hypothetical protein
MPPDTKDTQETIALPPLVSAPTDQHAQLMWVLGKMQGNLEDLKNAKIIQNGRVDKLELRMSAAEKWQYRDDGKDQGVSKLTLIVLNVLTALVAITALILKFIK